MTYWQAIDDELARVSAEPALELVPSRTTVESTFYEVRLTSIGPYRIFATLSIPSGPGRFPALLETPRYGSVNYLPHAHDRSRYVVLAVSHRGQRRADDGFAAAYPGLLTHGIEDPATYVYRGIVADCLRAGEFLLGLDAVDRSRVGVSGDDLALLTAARRPGFSAVRVRDLLLYRAMEAREAGVYPHEELNDQLRAGADEILMSATLEHFDARAHAVEADVLLATPDPAWVSSLTAVLPKSEVYHLTDDDGTDQDAWDAWLAHRLGVPAMPRFS
ncbi:acetylxylan esterase [Kribbella sp. NBC_01245]|uniref:acetylxylan esterase n=1 Tax=Kribbella sp. NBC_01245 TaxID=2903578 RepID=UPI002E2D9FAC|nr:acetylxylan esterase [Kribbella sp. NBC_01245]